jgi:hypothetical protein
MSVDFVKEKIGSSSIAKAQKQQKQLSYFTQSEIQEDITVEYVEKWANRNYSNNDDFLNWVKTIFKTDNFMSFFKYFRNPLASARLVNDRVKPQLQRVFFSEDAYFKYEISGEEVESPEELDVKSFNEWMFNALLFRHNDILIEDLEDTNTPFRDLISIDNVIAIESTRGTIHKLAYTASVVIEDEFGNKVNEDGYLYMDAFEYIFYSKEVKPLLVVPHDLGQCPADYISKEAFSNDDVVRKSIFSFMREEFEEYVFLKTLQRMTEPNGAIPIVTKLQESDNKKGDDIKGSTEKQPMTSNISGQKAEFGKDVQGKGSPLQAGSILEVPRVRKADMSLDMDVVQNFLNFFFIPIESLNYLNDRIKEVENSIVVTLLGDFQEQNESAKNELQVSKSFVNKQDKLRNISMELSRIREISDYKFLSLKYGKDRISNEAFYGSDFFLESENELYEIFEKSPNPIERKNILIRLTRNKNRFNKEKMERQVLLYHLLPYSADEDFEKAIERGIVENTIFEYQTRFNYWIGMFEAKYGDIMVFYNNLESEKSERIILINSLITQIIKQNEQKNSTPALGEG